MSDDHTPLVPSHRSTPLFPIPAFQDSNVTLWFRQLDHSFHDSTDQLSRYNAIITAIPFTLLTRIEDELSKAEDTSTPYDYIKRVIINATSASPHDRLTAILSQQNLGDRKPTDFLQHLLSLLSPGQATLEESLIRPLFLQKLPSQVQTVLSSLPLSTPLKEIAAAADRMLQVLPLPTINSVTSPSTSLPLSTPLPIISSATVPHSSEFRVTHLERERFKISDMRSDNFQPKLDIYSYNFNTDRDLHPHLARIYLALPHGPILLHLLLTHFPTVDVIITNASNIGPLNATLPVPSNRETDHRISNGHY